MSNLAKKLSDGQAYMKVWPKQPVLAALFPENRVISATSFSVKLLPAIAVLSVLLPFNFGFHAHLPQAVMMALVLLAMPLQGYYWLGVRASSPLPLSLASWYRQIYQRLAEAGETLAPAKTQPRYFELAEALNLAFRRLDDDFLS